ncbi:MAG: ABC transporter substrate-binding protein, partial [Aestuariivirga sp.]
MRIKSLFTAAGLALVLAGPPALAEILVGTAGPFSGPNAVLGEQIRRGTQQAIDDYNATGGLRGERLALKALDDGCDPRKA